MSQLILQNRRPILPVFIISALLFQMLFGLTRLIFEINKLDLFHLLYISIFSLLFLFFEVKIANRLFSKYIKIELNDHFFNCKLGFRNKKIARDKITNFSIKNNDDFSSWENFKSEKYKEPAIEMNNTMTYLFNANFGWGLYFTIDGKKKRIINGLTKDEAIKLKDFLSENFTNK